MSKDKWRRYKSKDNAKKNEHISVALTPTEKQILKTKAEQCDLLISEYVVAKTIYQDISDVIIFKNQLVQLRKEIKAIGKNLNQATKALNILAKDSNQLSSISLNASLNEVEKIRYQYFSIRKDLRTTLDMINKKIDSQCLQS